MSLAFFLVSSIFFHALTASSITETTYFLLFLLKQSYSICEQLHILLRSLTRYTLVSQRTTKCTVELSWLIQLILPLSVILLRRSAFLLLVFAWVLQILWQRLTLLLDGIPCIKDISVVAGLLMMQGCPSKMESATTLSVNKNEWA